MNNLKIDDLENLYSKKISIIKEIILFIFINIIVFILLSLFFNLQVIKTYLLTLKENKVKIVTVEEVQQRKIKNYKKIETIINEKLNEIDTNVKISGYEKPLDKFLDYTKIKYKYVFNLLPPENRIIIESIGVNAPIVDVNFVTPEKIEKADFDEELYKGVVRYPFTPRPGEEGNVLIFGHTSYYWWKKNPYGDIFAKIPLLKNGDIIKVIWEGKVYTYSVFNKEIVYPKQVPYIYEKYLDGKNLTLMGCYPIGTDFQRILIISKEVNNLQLTYK